MNHEVTGAGWLSRFPSALRDQRAAASRLRLGAHRLAFGIIAVLVLVALIVRVQIAASSGLWRDEVQLITITQLPSLREMWQFLVHHDSHPPLYYLLIRGWVRLFGASDLAVVLPSILLGGVLVVVGARESYRRFGAFAGVLSALFLAVAWPPLMQAVDVRSYVLMAVLVLAAVIAATRAIDSGPGRWWGALALFDVLLLYTHNWSLLVVATLALLTGIASLRGARPGSRGRRWVLAHVAVAVAYLPWIPALIEQAGAGGYPPFDRIPLAWPLITGYVLFASTPQTIVPALVVAAVAPLLWLSRTKRPSEGSFLPVLVCTAVVPTFLATMASTRVNLAHGNCIASLTPLILLALACLLGSAAGRRSGHAGLIVGAAFAMILTWESARVSWGKSNVREAAGLIAGLAREGDQVIAYPASIGPGLERYLPERLAVVPFPWQQVVSPVDYRHWWGKFSDPDELARLTGSVGSGVPNGRGIWLVTEIRARPFADSTAPRGSRGFVDYWILKRQRDLRDLLVKRYGTPTLSVRVLPWPLVREIVDVEHFGR